MSDIYQNFEQLRRLLVKIGYPHNIDREKICTGITTELLPLLHYGLLSHSKILATYILDIGYDLFQKNDLRFTEGVYRLLRNEFEYNPILQCSQFLTEKGFAKRKLQFVCQALKLGITKHNELIKKKKKIKMKWSETQLSKKVEKTIADQKIHQNKTKNARNRKKKKIPLGRNILLSKRTSNNSNIKNDQKTSASISQMISVPLLHHRPMNEREIIASDDEMRDELPIPHQSKTEDDEKLLQVENESVLDENPSMKTYDPLAYDQVSNGTLEMNDPALNPYIMQMEENRNLMLNETLKNDALLLSAIEEEPSNIACEVIVEESEEKEENETQLSTNFSNEMKYDGNHTPVNELNEEKWEISENIKTEDTISSDPPSHSIQLVSKDNIPSNVDDVLSIILSRLDVFNDKLNTIDNKVQNMSARVIVLEGRIKFIEHQQTQKSSTVQNFIFFFL